MASSFSALSPMTAQAASLTPFNAPKIGRNSSPDKIAAAAKQFEGSMISAMLQPMFAGLSTEGPFGGGEAEGTFRSFLVDAIAKQVEKTGGLHLSSAIQKEMIRMQQGGHQ
jgi:flagellar protein FlgJ